VSLTYTHIRPTSERITHAQKQGVTWGSVWNLRCNWNYSRKEPETSL